MKGIGLPMKRIASLMVGVLLFGMLSMCLIGCDTVAEPARQLPDGSAIRLGSDPVTLLSNEQMQLELLPSTMGVRVTDRRRDVLWCSNPENATGIQNAQFSLSYVDEKGNYSTMNSYTDAVRRQQVAVYAVPEEDAAYVQYRLGDYELTAEILPKNINPKRFQNRILDQLSAEEAQEMQNYYRYYESEDFWSLRTRGYAEFKRVYELLGKAGYTDEDILADNAEFGQPSTALNRPYFTVVLKYTLTADGFTVSAPVKYIECAEGYHLYKLTLFELFGAAQRGNDGYIFLPDGCGALMRFRQEKAGKEKLSLPVFGNDLTVTASAELDAKKETERVTLPVFGMKEAAEGYLAIIEDGAATATIEAYRAGGYNAYNAVYPVFTVTEKDNVYLEGSEESTQIPQFQQKLYDGDFRVRYVLLNDGDNGYSEMAAALRSYYIEQGVLKKQEAASLPFYLETIGGVTGYKNLLGISYIDVVSATSYQENITILQALQDAGVEGVRLILNGWFNGGVYHSYPKSIRLQSQLGGKSGFNKLCTFAADNGVLLYPQVNLMTVDRKGNGFWSVRHSARTLDLLEAEVVDRSYATGQKRADDGLSHGSSYILRPSVAAELTTSFLKAYDKYSLSGVYLSGSGNELYSDFLRSDTIDRNTSISYSQAGLQEAAKKLQQVMVSEGNSYALPYATDLLNVAAESSGYQMTDEDVPFLQMVLHSYVHMAGTPINLAKDSDVAPLKMLEYGMALHYQVTYEPTHVLKNTDYFQNYASHYEGWLAHMSEHHTGMAPLLNAVQQADMIRHQQVADGVFKTVYDNGVTIYVNYNEEEFTQDGLTIPAMGYVSMQEGG